jgi:hypothetical protein
MKPPLISVLLATVRGEGAYTDHPEWHAVYKVIEDLSNQSFKDFELIVVDGNEKVQFEPSRLHVRFQKLNCPFPVRWVAPRENIWTRNKKVCIANYRNTGLRLARGELVVNLDDCPVLPPHYLEVFAQGWKQHGVCAAATWPKRNDHRRPGLVTQPGQCFGFSSYPREAAFELGGYDESFDGGQGLEDCDWSTRLFHLGVKSALVDIPDFDILPQNGHPSTVIDPACPIVKCCNAAWQTQRVWRQVRRANVAEVYSPEALDRLTAAPCRYATELHGAAMGAAHYICQHHGLPCAYEDRSWFSTEHPLVAEWKANPPVFDLRKESEAAK